MARPLKLTAEIEAAVCEAIGKGLRLSDACRLLNLHPQTVRRWARLGRQRPQSRYGAFYANMKKADAELMIHCLGLIQREAEKGTWTAAAWLLERRWPERWSSFKKEFAAIQRQVRELERRAGLPPWEQTDPDRPDDDA